MGDPDLPTPTPTPRYWFRAKTFGWGWGPPCTWEGWLVMAAYLLMLSLAGVVFPPARNAPGFVASVMGLSAVLVAVCWWKGEPPCWRWGR